MELPKEYKNWIEFAQKCIDIQNEYPDTLNAIIDNSDHNNKTYNTEEYVINDVKAKAFDEILGNVNFNKNDVFVMKDHIMGSGYFSFNDLFGKMQSMIKTLISLSK